MTSKMLKTKRVLRTKVARFTMFLATVGVVAAMAGTAVQATGAYFSDTKTGVVGGNIGSIKVTTAGGSGADNLNFTFTNMLPGEPQTATGSVQNTGLNSQDVWIVFYNPDALHAINNLGTYGEVHVTFNGTPLFDSANLNDDSGGTCGPISPAGCWPLPKEIKLADNLGPTASGTFGFTFNYGPKLKGAAAEGGLWNCYPLSDLPSCTNAGLPYKIVATQHGIDPYNALNTTTP